MKFHTNQSKGLQPNADVFDLGAGIFLILVVALLLAAPFPTGIDGWKSFDVTAATRPITTSDESHVGTSVEASAAATSLRRQTETLQVSVVCRRTAAQGCAELRLAVPSRVRNFERRIA